MLLLGSRLLAAAVQPLFAKWVSRAARVPPSPLPRLPSVLRGPSILAERQSAPHPHAPHPGLTPPPPAHPLFCRLQLFLFVSCTGVTPDRIQTLACRISAAGGTGVKLLVLQCSRMGSRAGALLAGLAGQCPGVEVEVTPGTAADATDM